MTLAVIQASAQQSLDESIAVDGRYAAEVIRMERISSYPAEYPLRVSREKLPYDLAPLTSDFSPSLYPLPVPGMERDSKRGYLDAAIGSWLNSELRAGGWILPPSQSSPWALGAWIRHSSTSLWKPKTSDGLRLHKRYDYNEALGLQAARRLNNGQSIEARLDYGVRYFDYFMVPEAPTQTINRIKGDVSWNAAPGAAIDHRLGLSVSHFAYRDMVIPGVEVPWEPSRETTLHLYGLVSGCPGGTKADPEEGSLTLKGDAYGVFGSTGGDYGLISLTPSYGMNLNGLHFDAGVRVDLSVKAGTKSDPFSAFHLAPAVNVWFPTSHFTFYAKVTGGSELQTLWKRSELSQWLSPYEFSHTPIFAPVDAAIGFNAGPAADVMRGIEGGLQIRWKAVSHLPFYGWYPTAMMLGAQEGLELMTLNSLPTTLHGIEISGRLAWSLRDVANAEIKLAYTPQHNTRGFFNGIDRPRWTGSAMVAVRPASRLTLSAGLDWRGVRNIYGIFGEGESQQGYRLPDWLSLRLEADWTITKNISVGAGAYNLTNRKNVELPGVPTEGITGAARISWLF